VVWDIPDHLESWPKNYADTFSGALSMMTSPGKSRNGN